MVLMKRLIGLCFVSHATAFLVPNSVWGVRLSCCNLQCGNALSGGGCLTSNKKVDQNAFTCLRRQRNQQSRVYGLRVLSASEGVLPTLECVKNVRDLASVTGSPVKIGRCFRTACIATASEADHCLIVSNIKTLIDLRSDKEFKMDKEKYNSTVLDSYDSLVYDVKYSRSGRPKELVPKTVGNNAQERSRHMLSVIDQSLYKRGVWKKLGVFKKLRAALYAGFSQIRLRKLFIDYINNAGLPLLNELILDYGGPSIKAVMDVVSKLHI